VDLLKYSLKRLWQLVPTLFFVSLIVFLMVRMIPGDPVKLLYGFSDSGGADTGFLDRMREQYGLNDPLPVQYLNYMKGIFTGDLGISLVTQKPIAVELANRYQYTLILAVGGTLLGSILGVLFGVIAAVYHNKFGDNAVMVFSMLAVSTPSFFLAMLLMLLFSLQLRWLPSLGMTTPAHAVLPITTLGLLAVGLIARTTRSAMLDVINQDYIRTSRAKGISKWTIITSHAFKNALIPVLTAIGLRFGYLLAGAALVETVFSIPGLGRFMIDGVSRRDYPVVQSTVLVLATTFVVVNTLVDLLYGLVDPRVKFD
jgi:ABC-type dipeptide/oligopeptide/nickel transport system permease component